MSIFESLVISDGSIDKSSASNAALPDRQREIHARSGRGDEAMSRRGCLMFLGSTGTGLAHPRRKLPGSIRQNQWNDDGAEQIEYAPGDSWVRRP